MVQQTPIRAEQKVGERPTIDRHWRGLFLDRLGETSNVSEAARFAGINPSRAYKVRRMEPVFRESWHEALLEGYAHLEMEVLQRLRSGTGKDDAKYDFASALRLLTLHRETVASERATRRPAQQEGYLAALSAKLKLMQSREVAVKQMLLEDGRDADEHVADNHDAA